MYAKKHNKRIVVFIRMIYSFIKSWHQLFSKILSPVKIFACVLFDKKYKSKTEFPKVDCMALRGQFHKFSGP